MKPTESDWQSNEYADLYKWSQMMFKSANVGSVDRALRIIIGVILAVLPHTVVNPLWANPNVGYAMTAIGLVLIVTALVRFCPLYSLIGANTCRK